MALSGVFAYSMAKRMSKDRPDLRASLRATIKLQTWLAGLVPEPVRRLIARRDAAKATAKEAKEKEAAKAAAADKGKPDEPEYFL